MPHFLPIFAIFSSLFSLGHGVDRPDRSLLPNKHNILHIAPNYLQSHFNLNSQLANLLIEDDNLVHFLIPLSNPKEQEFALSKLNTTHPNMRIQVCNLTQKTIKWLENTPPDTKFMNPAPENVPRNSWTHRHYRQSPAIAYVESFMVMRDIIIQKSCFEPLVAAHRENPFTLGLVDLWDFGALAIFHSLNIQNTVLTQNFPLMSHLYDYMTEGRWAYDDQGNFRDYKQQLLENKVPEVFSTRFDDSRTNIDVSIAKDHLESAVIFNRVYELADCRFRKIFADPNFPTLRQLFMKTKYLFVNNRRAFDYDLGILPKRVKFFGGIHLPEIPAMLNVKDDSIILNVLELGHKVILFSLGTLVDSGEMPDHKFEALAKAFGQLAPIQIIWKYDTKILAEQKGRRELLEKYAKNVHIVDWVNQQGILAHPNLMVFLSHCGQNSVIESVYAGKPLICMPMSADQFYTANLLSRKGVALHLEHHDPLKFTVYGIRDTLEAMLNNYTNFVAAIQKLQEELGNEQIEPRKLFLETMATIR